MPPIDGPEPAKLFYVSRRIRLPVQVCSVDDLYLVVPSSEEIHFLWHALCFRLLVRTSGIFLGHKRPPSFPSRLVFAH